MGNWCKYERDTVELRVGVIFGYFFVKTPAKIECAISPIGVSKNSQSATRIILMLVGVIRKQSKGFGERKRERRDIGRGRME